MPDIFDEVADDLRAERTRRFLMRYAGAFIGAAAIVLVGIGGWKAWEWHRHQQDLHAASRYITLTDRIAQQASGRTKAGDLKDAGELAAFAKDAPPGYASLARLRAASLYAGAGDRKKAESIWAAVATKNNGATPLVRGLATLLSAQHQMGVAPNAAVRARLETLNKDANPWQTMAQLDIALLDMQAGKNKDARGLLESVSADPNSPPNLRNLAQGLIAKLNG